VRLSIRENAVDPLPKLTEAIIRQHASADSCQRGREYYEQGTVSQVVRRGQQVQAEVEGSQYEPYSVRITCDVGGITQALCSCPYDWGGWCKHIVATLLACVHDPAQVDERPSAQALLAELDREQLQGLLVRLLEQRPELADVIESQMYRIQTQPARGAPAAQQRRTPLDPNMFRRQVGTILRSLHRMRSSEAYWQVLEQAKGFVVEGDGRNALVILEAIAETYIADWVELDDSEAEQLTQWQHEVADYGVDEAFEVAVVAAQQGWEYPPLVRVLQGEITDKGAWEAEAPWPGSTCWSAKGVPRAISTWPKPRGRSSSM
jgi:uncharacterized Zn finger protein